MHLVKRLAWGASALVLASVGAAASAQSASETAPQADRANVPTDGIQDIIVTAQKRAESVNDVGMSIAALGQEKLLQAGISKVDDLARLVPGFTSNMTPFGTSVYTIRGIGFQDSTLGASPTVSTYIDEIPVPFSQQALGMMLDVERVEVLKGPQGTLYGQNSTGGAINFIAAKPTDDFQAGFNADYGRFNDADLQGFLSGAVGNRLSARIAVRVNQGDDWQRSYTRDDSMGRKRFIQGRFLVDWRPIDDLAISINLNGWRDRSDTAAAQLVMIVPQTSNPLLPGLAAYPPAPHDNRAADWTPGISYARDNHFYQGSLRADYELGGGLTLTSLSSYQRFKRNQPVDGDGTTFEDNLQYNFGNISTFYQELRLGGDLPSGGNWLVGANYERDNVFDDERVLLRDAGNSVVFGLPLDGSNNTNRQIIKTYAAYASVNHHLTDMLSFTGGIRYTKADRFFTGCNTDTGTGQTAAVINFLQGLLKGPGNVVPVQPGGCINLNAVTFTPEYLNLALKEDNISWRAGLDLKPGEDFLVYANVSKGYKAGGFPNLGATASSQFTPATQESVLAFELGSKATLFDRKLQLDAAFFYYKYRDKQIRGATVDPVFGPLSRLVNVPRSQIYGAEISATWLPFPGLTISPAASYVHSRIKGDFSNFTPFGAFERFVGEAFPYTPRWQARADVEYHWNIGGDAQAFLGGDMSYQSGTNAGFGNVPLLDIPAYTLFNLRAGIEKDAWRFSLWGRNITDHYYWTTAYYSTDTVNRLAGIPATYGVSLSYRFR
ncbi:TonB-dependent receptor [Sphingobium phenoxybenzoativorans]|uniref:TonB-dependent receptor n=1 Tax=Sphingobium phenoxybenzoativorans TaxID=1592790 RepID=UPI000873242A|nr:TonB-dependent receptor [Sphingobium phenoxybenzoativorans]